MAQGGMTITLDNADYRRIMDLLFTLSDFEKDAIIRRGLQEGARVFVRQGKSNLAQTLSSDPANVRMRKGNLIKSFRTKVNMKKQKVHAGFDKHGHHAHLVDSGTVQRWTRAGAYRGSVSKGSPKTGSKFWRNAFEMKKQEAANELMDSVYQSINKIMQNKR